MSDNIYSKIEAVLESLIGEIEKVKDPTKRQSLEKKYYNMKDKDTRDPWVIGAEERKAKSKEEKGAETTNFHRISRPMKIQDASTGDVKEVRVVDKDKLLRRQIADGVKNKALGDKN